MSDLVTRLESAGDDAVEMTRTHAEEYLVALAMEALDEIVKLRAERDALRGLLVQMRDGPPHLHVWQWLPRIDAALAKGE